MGQRLSRDVWGAALLAAGLLCSVSSAQWSPSSGQWGKTDPSDVRLMTWNVEDSVCSTNNKVEGSNNWCATARIIAAMKPDVVVFLEAGDNDGNGTGPGGDSAANLLTTIDRFLHGGLDPFKGNTAVTAYVQKYAPTYDLPYVYVSSETDGFNRNCILSRFPFKDLNGDLKATIADIPNVTAHLYAPGGDGGIRGFLFAEIDLPDTTLPGNLKYSGDLVVGGAHLKSGSAPGDLAQRLQAAQNVAYYVDHLFNGAGGGTPDPFSRIADSPPATMVLSPETPVFLMGDLNEDEATNGRKGPTEWLARAATTGGTDGTDKDRSDATWDSAKNPFNGSSSTTGSGKLDYMTYQDSVFTTRRAFVFYSAPMSAAWMPQEIVGFAGGTNSVSSIASDHSPVIIDAVLPLESVLTPPPPFALLTPATGGMHVPVEVTFTWEPAATANTYTFQVFDDPALLTPLYTGLSLTTPEVTPPVGTLVECGTYYWRVYAVNQAGATLATPGVSVFDTIRPADMNMDGEYDFFDFLEFQNLFNLMDPRADFDKNGVFDFFDFLEFQNAFVAGC